MVKKKSPEMFRKEVYELVKDEYTLLEDYKLSSTPISILHNKCGKVYSVRPNAFLKGHRCPYCNGNLAKKKDTNTFKKEVYDLVGDEYTVVGEYVNNATNISIRHNKCGRVISFRPNNFKHGSRCIECYYASLRITKDEAQKRLTSAIGDKYLIIKMGKSTQYKSLIKHSSCGKTFESRLDDIFQKHCSCPFCYASVGEQYIMDYLDNKDIEYTFQKTFSDLKDVNKLSYDFFLPNNNILIEYQGRQHFKPSTFGNFTEEQADERLGVQKKHDTMKREYAKSKGIKLLTPNFKLNTFEKLCKFMDDNLGCL